MGMVKTNQHAKYLGQRSFSSTAGHSDTQAGLIALSRPLKWSVFVCTVLFYFFYSCLVYSVYNDFNIKPDIERVQTLADIGCSALCCHSNETREPIANPPNTAQLEGTPYHSSKLYPGPCSSVRMWRGTDRRHTHTQTHTHTYTQTALTTVHFASATPHAKCNKCVANLVKSSRCTASVCSTKTSLSSLSDVTVGRFIFHTEYLPGDDVTLL